MYRDLGAHFGPPSYLYRLKAQSSRASFQARLSRKWIFISLSLVLIISLSLMNWYSKISSWEPEQLLAPLFGFRGTSKENAESSTAYLPYQKIVWITFASIIAGVLLSISGNISQSLLQNPLADCSTLGMMDGAAFGLMFLKSLLGANIGSYYWAHFLISFIFAFLVFSLILFLFNSKSSLGRENLSTMLILFGLVLNIFFRTATHLAKEYSETSIATSYALALGGAENIYDLFPSQFLLIQIAIPVTILLFLGVRLLSKNLNLAELGFEQAHSLGVNVKLLQFVGYFMILCCNTLTINLVGNIAFLGLISTHIARKLSKTRKYEIIIPISAAIASLLLIIAVSINNLLPFISSSNLILGLGAILLLCLIKGRA